MSPPRNARRSASAPRAASAGGARDTTTRKRATGKNNTAPAARKPAAASKKRAAATPAAAPQPLSQTQRRYLRGLAHDLKAVILLGNKGVTAAVEAELARALDHHELVKVKLSGGDREQRQQQLDALLSASGGELVQQIGHTATLFRRNADEPRLALPR